MILFFIFAFQLSSLKNNQEVYRSLFTGVFCGAVLSVVLGLLDFYGIISLAWYRFGTILSAGVIHSTFLNRGWFAEFIITVIPFVLLGFMSEKKSVYWNTLLFAIIILCEIALILAGAKAGWVSYPVVLFFCWLSFYFFKEGRLELSRFRSKDFIKVIVSVPITILISLILVFKILIPLSDNLQNKTKGIQSGSEATSQYLERTAFDLLKKESRTLLWKDSLNIGRESPILGMGYDSYNLHANILSNIQDSYYGKNRIESIYDTPHNIYLQLLVSGGIAGLSLWTLIVGYTLMILVIDLIKHKRFFNIPVIISIISFHTYGIFQSMQYIPMIWLLIFLNFGYAMTIKEGILSQKHNRIWNIISVSCVIITTVSVFFYYKDLSFESLRKKYSLKVYSIDEDRDNYAGFYHLETSPTGRFRWSGKKAVINLSEDGVMELTFGCHHPDVEKEPVILSVFLNKSPLDKVTFTSTGNITKQYYIPVAPGDKKQLLLSVSRTWNPYIYKVNEDKRELGVAVSEIKFLSEMHQDGKCHHPHINKDPVEVEIIGDLVLIKEEIFIDNGWKKVHLSADVLKDAKILTLQVSRTWDPKLYGLSEDNRDLGVAIAIAPKVY